MRKVLRQEKKFIINIMDYYKNAHTFGQILMADPHNQTEGYLVRSLYFDTIYEKDYEDKLDGVSVRKKIRLRVYDPKADFAFLEIKQKEKEYQMKRSLKVTKEDAEALIHMQYDVLLKYDNPFAKECYALLTKDQYVPKTVVEYRRKAYIAKENSIRLTFDFNIMASETNFNIFDEKLLLYPVFPKENVVFEVKYNGFLLSYIKNLMDNCNRSELSVSKYCLARTASLNYVY